MGRSPRWIFSEIIDSLLSITPPGLGDEIDGLAAAASLSVRGAKNKVDSASAFSSPVRASLTSPLSSSKSMETAVSSPYREGEERFEAPRSPRKPSMASDRKAIEEVRRRLLCLQKTSVLTRCDSDGSPRPVCLMDCE